MKHPDVMTTTEAAAQTGLSISTIRRYAIRLGAMKTGRDYLLYPSEVERIVAAVGAPGRRGPKSPALQAPAA